jgi:hypothetical protein
MTNIDLVDLLKVNGGAPAVASKPESFNEFSTDLKGSIEGDYKSLVCKAAGFKGGDMLATQLYGDKATDADKERASTMITAYCNAGSQLPAAAPPLPL